MRKQLFTLLLVMLSLVTFGQQWVAINGNAPSKYQVELVASSDRNVTVDLQLSGFYTNEVTTPQGQAYVISAPKTVSVAAAGNPEVPMIPIPAVIGDRALMSVRIVSADYTDYENMEIAPSKGSFPRSINPADVPYTYGEAYQNNAFFPAEIVELDEPYIHRDVRAQNMMVTPFQYNPVTKVLRVYHHLVLSMDQIGYDTRNVFEYRSNTFALDPDFKAMYENRYINYNESMSRYTAIEETGELLVICYDNFMSAMEPFVNWKKQIGRPTTMVGTSTAGSTNSAIKSYISSYYSSHPSLTDVLLVGDVGQIPGMSGGSGSYAGKGDNPYGQVAGSDRYNDIIIGRFCCETAAQVTNHVNKVINYEKELNASATWLTYGDGIGNGDGPGHYSEKDYQHIENIRTDLLGYNYTTVYQDYPGVSGYSSSASTLSQHINNGVSIIDYCNHGSETGWALDSYSISNVNALTNDYKLPFVFSVACLVGKYDYSGGCFAEAWMRATNNSNGNPTGAIGGMFSYISQPWQPPMYGQDEAIDILVESYSNRIRRTMGGVSINGIMAVLDLGASSSENYGTYETWILYGDPTLTLRNAVPQDMGISHAPTMYTSSTNFVVNATNGNGALATLTRNNEIMGSATITNGTANITFTAPGTTGTATLTVFGYNKITYIAEINIVGGGASEYTINVSANPTAGGTVTGGGTYSANSNRTVTATANTGYTFKNWTENGAVVSTSASYTFSLTYDRNLVANFEGQTFTVTATANPADGGSVALGGRGRETLTYDFEGGYQGWTTLKGTTGNSSHNWMHISEWTYAYNYSTMSSGHGHNESDGYMLSESYITGSSSGSGTAVTPDNYLVSPEVVLGGSITFYAGFQNVSYCNEKFSVMVSTTGNNAVSNFTTVQTWTFSPSVSSGSEWKQYTVDLSAYSGMGYIAIRHFDCNDQWFLCVDDVTIVEGEYVNPGYASETYNYGQTCVATATPNSGYYFSNWTENGTVVSTNATYSFTVTADRNLVANFTTQQTQNYTVAVSASPANGGNVTGGGTFQQGQSCTVVASPNTNYTFTNWTENGTVVSTNASYTFTVNANRTLVANFTYVAPTYNVSVSASPANGGNVTGGGTYTQGQSCTVVASPNANYTFVNWTENGTVVSGNASYTFTVNGNRTLVANFNYVAPTYTINVSANPANGGSVTGGGTFTEGQSCTVVASPNANYTFVNWTENGTVVSGSASYTFTVNGNRTLVANFNYVAPTYTVNVSANPTNGGNVTGDGTYTEGQSCTVVASPNAGYNFTNWTENGAVVSGNASYTFTVNANHNLVANFELQTVTISVTVDPAQGGTITGDGTYNYGEQVTLVLTPAEDYAFQNWTENGAEVSTSLTYTFTATANRNLVAHLLYTEGVGEQENNVMVYPNPTNGAVTVEGEGLTEVRIVNAFGQMVYYSKVEGEQVRIDLSQMANGVYVMHIGTENGVVVKQIVVR